MQQNAFGSAQTRWGSLSTPPDPLASKRGPTSKGKGGEGREGKETGRDDVARQTYHSIKVPQVIQRCIRRDTCTEISKHCYM